MVSEESEYLLFVCWFMVLFLKGSFGLKDWIQFLELGNICQIQCIYEIVRKNQSFFKLGKGMFFGGRKIYFILWRVNVIIYYIGLYFVDERYYFIQEDSSYFFK